MVISGDDTILGRLEISLGMYQANTFLSGYDKLSDIFHNSMIAMIVAIMEEV